MNFYTQFHFWINFLPPHSQLKEEFEFVEFFSAFFLPQFLYILNILSHTGFEFLHFLRIWCLVISSGLIDGAVLIIC